MPQVVIKLPDVGEGTAQAELAAWHVRVGDKVVEDQNLADVTTDKATVEIPSPASGKIISLKGQPGDVIAVGSPLIVIETDLAAVAPAPEPAKPVLKVVEAAKPEPAKPSNGHTKVLASPAVRSRATSLNIDLARVVGSGPGGRVIHKDLDTYLLYQGKGSTPSQAKRDGVTETKIIGVRRKIAEKMQESKRNIPHYSYVEEVDVTALEELRVQLNERYGASRPKLSILPFIMTAVVKALPEFPQVNAHFDDEAGVLRQFQAVHIGMATQTDKGLMVPVIANAEARDLWALADDISRLSKAARDGSADRKELSGSTITITSLGKLGGIVSTPVINRPEVAIVGVNKIWERPVVRSGQVVVRSMMNLSSSFDHRVVDGFDAASFIQRVRALLEQPATLFLP